MTVSEERLTPKQMASIVESGGSIVVYDREVSGHPFVVEVTTTRPDSRPTVYVAHLSDGRDLRAQTGYGVRVTCA